MSIEFKFQPLKEWPRESTPAAERKGSPFKIGGKIEKRADGSNLYVPGKTTPLSRTYDDLKRELAHLGVDGVVVLQVGLKPDHIRISDQLPRADAPKPKHPGVILSFEAKFGARTVPLRYLCDDCTAWQDNLRAIALTLERLRLADLYGVTKRNEQYAGFAALPPATALVTPPKMTLEEAARLLVKESGATRAGIVDAILSMPDTFKSAYHVAAKKNHPDVNRGVVSETWQRIQEAAALLRSHHGL